MATNEGFVSKTDELYEKLGKLTGTHRIGIVAATVVLAGVLFFFFGYSPLSQELSDLGDTKESLENQLITQKKKAALLPKYKKKMERARSDFTMAMNKLPEKSDIPILLSNISGAARDAGLEIQLFKPQKLIIREFYAEIPVSIKVAGSYHKMALFFDNVSRLSRIVNIKDISFKADKVSCTAVTYMFIEPKEKKKKKK